jgi:hypothetical protein
MQEKVNSTLVFEVRIWNPNYYVDKKVKRKDTHNVYNGMLRLKGVTSTIPFHSAGQLLSAIEENFYLVAKKGVKKNEDQMQ